MSWPGHNVFIYFLSLILRRPTVFIDALTHGRRQDLCGAMHDRCARTTRTTLRRRPSGGGVVGVEADPAPDVVREADGDEADADGDPGGASGAEGRPRTARRGWFSKGTSTKKILSPRRPMYFAADRIPRHGPMAQYPPFWRRDLGNDKILRLCLTIGPPKLANRCPVWMWRCNDSRRGKGQRSPGQGPRTQRSGGQSLGQNQSLRSGALHFECEPNKLRRDAC